MMQSLTLNANVQYDGPSLEITAQKLCAWKHSRREIFIHSRQLNSAQQNLVSISIMFAMSLPLLYWLCGKQELRRKDWIAAWTMLSCQCPWFCISMLFLFWTRVIVPMVSYLSHRCVTTLWLGMVITWVVCVSFLKTHLQLSSPRYIWDVLLCSCVLQIHCHHSWEWHLALMELIAMFSTWLGITVLFTDLENWLWLLRRNRILWLCGYGIQWENTSWKSSGLYYSLTIM